KVACVDINPATVTKLIDRGSIQTVGVVTDVEPFLRALVCELVTLPSLLEKTGSRMRNQRILMCTSDSYRIWYEINPWIYRSSISVPQKAKKQWQGLYEILCALGVTVELLRPQPGLPDLVFTANAGLLFGNRFFSSRFRHEVRARETPFFDA